MTGWPLFGRMLRSITLRWALVLLMLAAQQGALTHALGHAAGHAHESIAVQHDHDQPVAAHADHTSHEPVARIVSEQCALDLVYSQVLGGMHAGHALHFSAAGAVAHAVIVLPLRGTTTDVPYDSRGPPVLS